MTTAPPEDQRRLLEVQALDIRLQQLAHRRASLPAIARVAELDAQIADLNTSLVQSRTSASDLRRELTKAEGDVEQVRTRAARDQARLDSGQVGAKDAQALVSELEALGRRQGVLEEVELDVMERLEAHEVALGQLESANADLESAKADAERERDAEAAVIDAEIAQVTAERETSVAGIDAGLLALYDKVRAQNGGRGVVALKGTFAEGLNVNLSPVELREITSAAPDQVVRLEDYGHIVVRLDADA
ncbi:hypothetical protein CLV28_1478 [Sediminihabitans luteus]|uniref:CT398-like coiled coil hairpin domain-containing protein n=1 Tax=Sediminihabitans luteus TaxID=1138585 RepID=A0A2M9CQ84_9CELL|nr:hypothetical protein [Sediminihabitans luteus]PJJ73991.1 hypothetical protein CLV28_1478 [Sediminihabitans luteus]GII98096.1 hypothetical protein Slu03_04740 [Sediminihabitans luteus]